MGDHHTRFRTMNAQRHYEEYATICSDRKQFIVRVPPTDITSSIHVSLRQRLLTVIAIALVVSDIPRAGLTITPQDYYARAGPGIVMYWGPFEYHVAHLTVDEAGGLNSTHPVIEASCDGNPLELLDLWPYKRDTLSIAPRAMAEYLNVTSYPRCVLYRGPCDASTLNPSTVFHMLDGLATAVQQRFFQDEHEHSPVAFFTKSNWVDRLHHFLFRFVTDNPDNRLHAAYHASLTTVAHQDGDVLQRIFDQPTARKALPQGSNLCVIPFLCTSPVKWSCEHPIHPNGRRALSLVEHIEARVEELARQYPDVELDFTMFTSSTVDQTRRNSQYIPSVSYMTDTIEVTTLVRGMRCDASRTCTTVFVDDYRYERSWIESDANQWTSYLGLLRGLSQLYIWIRVVALFCGCVGASQSESRNHRSNFLAQCRHVWSILFSVPGHAVVYGSWPPLVLYSLAHYFDSSLVQSVGEFAWASVGGLDDFHLVQYAGTVSIQMRNIWMIALLCKLAHALLSELKRGRCVSINPARAGLLSFRSGWIGFVSWLTTFALMRAVPFRNTDIVSVQVLSRHVPIESFRPMPVYRNFVDYGPRFDLKCTLLAVVATVGVGWVAKILVRAVSGRGTALFWSSTHYIPLSAGRLWPWSMLDGVWALTLRDQTRAHVNCDDSTGPSATKIMPYLPESTQPDACAACSFRGSVFHWRATLGCALHEPILDVPRRTKAIWSMVRLTNIAAMTDPIALVRFYVIGTPLYLYRVVHTGTPYLLLQPTPPPRATSNAKAPLRHATWTAEGASHTLEFVATVDSRDVPWRVLINCG